MKRQSSLLPHLPPEVIEPFSMIIDYDLPRWSSSGMLADLLNDRELEQVNFPNPQAGRGKQEVRFGWMVYRRPPSSARVLRDSRRQKRRSPTLAEAVTVLEATSLDDRLDHVFVAMCGSVWMYQRRRIGIFVADADNVGLFFRVPGPPWNVKTRHLIVLP